MYFTLPKIQKRLEEPCGEMNGWCVSERIVLRLQAGHWEGAES